TDAIQRRMAGSPSSGFFFDIMVYSRKGFVSLGEKLHRVTGIPHRPFVIRAAPYGKWYTKTGSLYV
ncbi:MAG: hypothetical protein OXN22_05070, partial [Deltaproteobacteria bacterium]|nr:hypothetical protein [Deltaproteobacteria bacterium]